MFWIEEVDNVIDEEEVDDMEDEVESDTNGNQNKVPSALSAIRGLKWLSHYYIDKDTHISLTVDDFIKKWN